MSVPGLRPAMGCSIWAELPAAPSPQNRAEVKSSRFPMLDPISFSLARLNLVKTCFALNRKVGSAKHTAGDRHHVRFRWLGPMRMAHIAIGLPPHLPVRKSQSKAPVFILA